MSMSTDNEDQLTRGEIWEKSRRYAFIPPTFDTLREEETAFMKDLSNLWVRIQLCLEWVDEPWEYRQLQVREINELREHLKAGDEICRYLRERQSQMRRIWRTEIARAKDVITEFDKRIESPDDDEVGWRSAEELCEDVARLSTTSWILDLKLSNDKSDLESAISCFNAAFGGDRMEERRCKISLKESSNSYRIGALLTFAIKPAIKCLEFIKARLAAEDDGSEPLRPTGVSFSRHYHK